MLKFICINAGETRLDMGILGGDAYSVQSAGLSILAPFVRGDFLAICARQMHFSPSISSFIFMN